LRPALCNLGKGFSYTTHCLESQLQRILPNSGLLSLKTRAMESCAHACDTRWQVPCCRGAGRAVGLTQRPTGATDAPCTLYRWIVVRLWNNMGINHNATLHDDDVVVDVVTRIVQ
jgi:hypothetical protein